MTAPSRATLAGQAYLDLRAKARSDGRPVDELLQLYVLESVLARLAESRSADQLVRKGVGLPFPVEPLPSCRLPTRTERHRTILRPASLVVHHATRIFVEPIAAGGGTASPCSRSDQGCRALLHPGMAV